MTKVEKKGNRELKSSRLAGKKISIMNGDLKQPLLGHIVGYTIKSCELPTKAIDDLWNEMDIPQWCKPKPLRPKDVFKNAVRTLDTETHTSHPTYGDVLVAFVTDKAPNQNEYFLTRKIFATSDDAKKNQLHHEKLCRITFKENHNTIIVSKYDEKSKMVTKSKVEEYQTQLQKAYDHKMTVYNSIHLTRAIRDSIKGINGIPYTCGQGGVWFIPIEGQSIMAGWKEFLSRIAEAYSTRLNRYPTQLRALPCVDSKEQRRFLSQDVAQQTEARFNKMLQDTLTQLHSCNPDNIEKILEGKLESRIDTYETVQRYQKLLGRKIELYMETLKVKDIKDMKDRTGKTLSGRAQAMIRQLSQIDIPTPGRLNAMKKQLSKDSEEKKSSEGESNDGE